MRYFMDLSYNGTNYHGWQVQKNAKSVQETVNQALTTILQSPTECVASGRTDTGVHAKQQIAHFDCDLRLQTQDFAYKLNVLLPSDIAVKSTRAVDPKAHARFDALKRTYHYYIHKNKNPFKEGFSYHYNQSLDTSCIEKATKILVQNTDFKAFSKVKTDVKSFDCSIYQMSWETYDDGHRFVVSANRFLRGMVRALVGTLLDVGMLKTSTNDLQKIIENGDRSEAGRAVPPEGLYLTAIEYPANVYID